ncbi:Site-specific tyrosine recombinase [hydrothermal vent metagenome]|uniref:Site-specific tyrosine recombinase n=1 Tax=hydrothermal vent metagenome TaxID=652676 RepID=A0A3B0XP60_9ZZZZ
MKPSNDPKFNYFYERHYKHLELKGLQPKTIDAYSRAIRRIGEYFNYEIEHLTQDQLVDYFHDLLGTHSWSTVKLDLYGLKFFYTYTLSRPWMDVEIVKKPKASRIPDIITPEQLQSLFINTRVLSYRVFFFTVYSMGLRLGEPSDWLMQHRLYSAHDESRYFLTNDLICHRAFYTSTSPLLRHVSTACVNNGFLVW